MPILVIFFLLFLFSSSSFGLTPNQLIENPIVKYSVSEIPQLSAQTISSIHVVKWQNTGWHKVPFQIVEMDELGLPYFAKGPNLLSGKSGVFDGRDELWLQSSAFGEKVTTEHLDKGQSEVCISSEKCLYVSLIPLQTTDSQSSIEPLVQFDAELADIKTSHFSLNMNPKNYFLWDDFFFFPYQGPQQESLLDTIKIRLAGGVFSRFTRIELDNHNLRARLLDYQSGDISTILLLKTKVIIAKIPVMSLHIYFQVFPQQIDISAHASLPAIFKKVLKNPTMSISLDGNKLLGAEFTTALGNNNWGVVDGKIDNTENQLIKNGISNEASWIWFDTGDQFSLACFMDVPENFDIPISLFYEDDGELENKPERFRGQWPNIGYQINAIPREKEFFFTASLVFSSRSKESVLIGD